MPMKTFATVAASLMLLSSAAHANDFLRTQQQDSRSLTVPDMVGHGGFGGGGGFRGVSPSVGTPRGGDIGGSGAINHRGVAPVIAEKPVVARPAPVRVDKPVVARPMPVSRPRQNSAVGTVGTTSVGSGAFLEPVPRTGEKRANPSIVDTAVAAPKPAFYEPETVAKQQVTEKKAYDTAMQKRAAYINAQESGASHEKLVEMHKDYEQSRTQYEKAKQAVHYQPEQIRHKAMANKQAKAQMFSRTKARASARKARFEQWDRAQSQKLRSAIERARALR